MEPLSRHPTRCALTVAFAVRSPSSRAGRALCTLFLPFACAAALRSISVLSGALARLTVKEKSTLEVRTPYAFSPPPSPAGLRLCLHDPLQCVVDCSLAQDDGGLDDMIARMRRMLSHGAGDDGLVSESDFIASTLVELGLVEVGVLTQVREQFYRLDKRAVGYLNMDACTLARSNSPLSLPKRYPAAGLGAPCSDVADEELLLLKQGGAKKRWQFAASTVLREKRVAAALKFARHDVNPDEARARRESRISVMEEEVMKLDGDVAWQRYSSRINEAVENGAEEGTRLTQGSPQAPAASEVPGQRHASSKEMV